VNPVLTAPTIQVHPLAKTHFSAGVFFFFFKKKKFSTLLIRMVHAAIHGVQWHDLNKNPPPLPKEKEV
jgi:hypothetical protein